MKNVGLNSQEWQEIFLSPEFQRVALVATQSPIQWVMGGSFHRGEAAGGCETDTSHPPSVRVKHETVTLYPCYMTTLPLYQKYYS